MAENGMEEGLAAVQSETSQEPVANDACNFESGRGLDVGTANLASSIQDVEGNVTIKIQRNAFIEIDADDYTRNMLTRLNVQYVSISDRMVVVGDPAFELANIFNRETRRPMKDGVISPNEQDALPIEKMLLETLLGPPSTPKEKCYYSVPAEPIDADFNVIYHKGVFGGILKKIGYEPKPLVEGHAVVLSELADDDFTGIGISCGGGMFNICVAYKAIPCLSFSTSRGGDWIDRNVATVLGIKASRATAIKERGINILVPRNREEEAVEIYYRNLIAYTLENIKTRFETAEGMPSFPEPIEIVCAGGTSMIGGFIEVFKDEFESINFPIEVKNIRRAEDPLYSVSKGCLVAALSDGDEEEE
ncbi:MAG: cell division protein FtsA [Planctomycetota bacterium]